MPGRIPQRLRARKLRPFLHYAKSERRNLEKARRIIAADGSTTGMDLFASKEIPKHQAYRILDYLEEMGEHNPPATRFKVKEGMAKRRTPKPYVVAVRSQKADRREKVFLSALNHGFERRIPKVEELADELKLPIADVESDIKVLRGSARACKDYEYLELLDLILLKTAIINNPAMANGQLQGLLKINSTGLQRRLTRLQDLDKETLRLRSSPAFKQTAESKRFDRLVRRFVFGEIPENVFKKQAARFGVTDDASKNRVSRMRKKLGLNKYFEEERAIAAQIAANPQDAALRNTALEKLATFPHLKPLSSSQLSRRLTNLVYDLRRESGNRPRRDKK